VAFGVGAFCFIGDLSLCRHLDANVFVCLHTFRRGSIQMQYDIDFCILHSHMCMSLCSCTSRYTHPDACTRPDVVALLEHPDVCTHPYVVAMFEHPDVCTHSVAHPCGSSHVAWLHGSSWLSKLANMGDPCQLWMGNVPPGLSEQEVIATLALYSVRPYKVALRHRTGGEVP